MPRSAILIDEIAQFPRDFDLREATLNLRVVGSIPTRLTTSRMARRGFVG